MPKLFAKLGKKVKTLIPRKKKLEDTYEITANIGSGMYSLVNKGYNKKTGEQVAFKTFEKETIPKGEHFSKENILNEVEILKKIGEKHPHIVSYKDFHQDKKRMVIIMELLSGGELLEKLRKKKFYYEKEASIIMKQIIEAVSFLHSLGIVHRDLKPENILYSTEEEDSSVKICDFGFARWIGDGYIQDEECGSPAYIAPEIVAMRNYNKSVDMWSVGVITYILLCGFPPFYDDDTDKLIELVKEGKYDFPDPFWSKVSKSAKDLVSALLQVDPKQRITADAALKHPWISGLAISKELDLPSLEVHENLKSSAEFKAVIDKGNEIQRGPAEEKENKKKLRRKNSSKPKRDKNSKGKSELKTSPRDFGGKAEVPAFNSNYSRSTSSSSSSLHSEEEVKDAK